MRPGQLRGKAIATVAVLAALSVGAATLWAAIGEKSAAGAPRMQLAAAGAISLTNSKDGAAIFNLANIGPGLSGHGEVTIGNMGSAAGTLALSSLELSDAPGRYGGALSQRLELRIEDVTAGSETAVYSGQLASMPELQLGTLAGGESRTYSFVVTMLDGGPPSSPYVDDNLYQLGTTSLGYQWTLSEVEGEDGEPEEPPPPGEPPHPSPPSLPATAEPGPPPSSESGPPPSSESGPEQIGTPRADRLIGTSKADVIYGRGGPDRILGRGGQDYLVAGVGADWLHGGAGADRLRGGVGRDHVHAGAEADIVFARDGEADFIDCGGGRDLTYVDEHDVVRGCERVHRQYGRLFSIEEAPGSPLG